MCIICVDLTKDKLTHKEARRNLGEMRTQIPDEHKQDVLRLIWKKEDEEFQKSHKRMLTGRQTAYLI